MAIRQIVLDTETTGLDPSQGHRIIEIGCVELVNRRATGEFFHQYINPEREIDPGAMAVHGIKNEFLLDKPRFQQVAAAFIEFIRDAELIIHNAAFDVGFLNHELLLLNQQDSTSLAVWQPLAHYAQITDSLLLARRKHPNQKNNLDALCKRYQVNNRHRDWHGALLDAQLLADVYLAMTGGQVSLDLRLDSELASQEPGDAGVSALAFNQQRKVSPALQQQLIVLQANLEEQQAHDERLQQLAKKSGSCLWLAEI